MESANDYKLIPPRAVEVSTILPGKAPSVSVLNERGILINGWEIITQKGAISNSVELDSLANNFVGLPFPEMFFGNNNLRITHVDSGSTIRFNAVDGLKEVLHGDSFASTVLKGKTEDSAPETQNRLPNQGMLKVAHADHWASRSSAYQTSDIKGIVKPYDWTYTSEYSGTFDSGFKFASTVKPIDVEHLKKQEPILFYDELVLYEDELHDNGVALLDLRVRVMPSCLLVLLRFFLRVDGVLFRIHETRLFHRFEDKSLIKEVSMREESYADVKARLPKARPWELQRESQPIDLSLLTDINWVTSNIPNPWFGQELTNNDGKWEGSGKDVVNQEFGASHGENSKYRVIREIVKIKTELE